MQTMVQILGSLLGVLVGGGLSYWAATASERNRRNHERSARLDQARLAAYSEYGYAVKHVNQVALRICAARGFDHAGVPLETEEGISMLAKAETERAEIWERLLLLGSPQAIDRARMWHVSVWKMQGIARGEPADKNEWRALFLQIGKQRDLFYDAARLDLGISGVVPRGANPWGDSGD